MVSPSAAHPVLEIIFGTSVMIVIIFLHGVGLRAVNRRFTRFWVRANDLVPNWRFDLALATTIASLGLLHFIETLVWAVPIYGLHMVASMRDSYYYVLESYTTLGEGSVSLPDEWRLIGPIIAMSGLFTFGWTGSVLVNIMTEFGKLDKSRMKQRDAVSQ